jgi:hypothetical protein
MLWQREKVMPLLGIESWLFSPQLFTLLINTEIIIIIIIIIMELSPS